LVLVCTWLDSSMLFLAAPPSLAEAEADVSSSHVLMCFKFLRSIDAELRTSVFMSIAKAPTPTTVTTKFDKPMVCFTLCLGLHEQYTVYSDMIDIIFVNLIHKRYVPFDVVCPFNNTKVGLARTCQGHTSGFQLTPVERHFLHDTSNEGQLG
jgi:hypothetical protein